MRLRRNLFRPYVHVTNDARRPITLSLICPANSNIFAEYDLTAEEARRLADLLADALKGHP